jgi:hypothetical protein
VRQSVSRTRTVFLPYVSIHFNSSLTAILTCHGFVSNECPSPGKISNEWGIPLVYKARSSKWLSKGGVLESAEPLIMSVGVVTLPICQMAASAL